jgi:hypothetical protein
VAGVPVRPQLLEVVLQHVDGHQLAVGLVHPHPVDDFAAILGHDVEQVVDDGGVGAVLL